MKIYIYELTITSIHFQIENASSDYEVLIKYPNECRYKIRREFDIENILTVTLNPLVNYFVPLPIDLYPLNSIYPLWGQNPPKRCKKSSHSHIQGEIKNKYHQKAP
jgi:hypothetical protein